MCTCYFDELNGYDTEVVRNLLKSRLINLLYPKLLRIPLKNHKVAPLVPFVIIQNTMTNSTFRSINIRNIKENRIETLRITKVYFDLKHMTDVADALYYNNSIETIEFVSTDGNESNQWLPMLTAFQQSHIRQKVFQVLLADNKIPFVVATSFLWQFRNLQEITISNHFFANRSDFDDNHWRSLTAAFWNHPSLKRFNLSRRSTTKEIIPGNDFLATTLANTVPSLTYYKQNGHLKSNTIISLVRSRNIETLICSQGDFNLDMNEASQLQNALYQSKLINLSFELSSFNQCATWSIARGVQVSSSYSMNEVLAMH